MEKGAGNIYADGVCDSYLKMISTATEGGTVINYSDRFTITGMTGSVTASVKNAVTALGGSTAGPPTENDVANGGAAAPPASAPPAGAFGIPFTKQTGLTRYAPMQGVPPTKITKKGASPLFPTSAYTVAKTWLPLSIVTTLTESQTFSVQSHANTVCHCNPFSSFRIWPC